MQALGHSVAEAGISSGSAHTNLKELVTVVQAFTETPAAPALAATAQPSTLAARAGAAPNRESFVQDSAGNRLGFSLANGTTASIPGSIYVGGEVRTRGRNEAGAAWQVAIERPSPHGDAIQRLVPLSDLAITTAGDYRKYREVDGQRVAHILDPRTGRPLTHRLASVTVIDALAVRADAFDTALMVLGTEEGMALATKLNLAALFIERNGDRFVERATPRFEEIASKR